MTGSGERANAEVTDTDMGDGLEFLRSLAGQILEFKGENSKEKALL